MGLSPLTLRGRRGASVIEFIVIVIAIGVPAALLASVGMKIYGMAVDVSVADEIRQLSDSCERFNERFGVYPPDMHDPADAVALMQRAFPKCPPKNYPNFKLYSPASALPLWLAGIDGRGMSDDPLNPFGTSSERQKPLMAFDRDRLKPNAKGVLEYYPPRGVTGSPYVYFRPISLTSRENSRELTARGASAATSSISPRPSDGRGAGGEGVQYLPSPLGRGAGGEGDSRSSARSGATAGLSSSVPPNTARSGATAGLSSSVPPSTARSGATAGLSSSVPPNAARSGATAGLSSSVPLNTARSGATAGLSSSVPPSTARQPKSAPAFRAATSMQPKKAAPPVVKQCGPKPASSAAQPPGYIPCTGGNDPFSRDKTGSISNRVQYKNHPGFPPAKPYCNSSDHTWINADSFQIISAGRDGRFGVGNHFPAGDNYDEANLDDISNFSFGRRMEKSMP